MTGSIRLTLIVLLLAVALIFGMVVGRQALHDPEAGATPPPDLSQMNTYIYAQARPLADYRLTNEKGEVATQEDLKGRWTFGFVGYTFCPDICPATMATLRRTSREFPSDLPKPEFLFVTADPERDTPDRLKDYLDFFGEDFHAVTGDLDGLREMARSMSAVFVHREDGNGNLLVDHSGHLTLINPDGRLVALIQPPHEPEKLITVFREIYQWARTNHPRASVAGS